MSIPVTGRPAVKLNRPAPEMKPQVPGPTKEATAANVSDVVALSGQGPGTAVPDFPLDIATRVPLSMVSGLAGLVAGLVPQDEVQDGFWTPSQENQKFIPVEIENADLAPVENPNLSRQMSVITHIPVQKESAPKRLFMDFAGPMVGLESVASIRGAQNLEQALQGFWQLDQGSAKSAYLNMQIKVPEASLPTLASKTMVLLNPEQIENGSFTGTSALAPDVDEVRGSTPAMPGSSTVLTNVFFDRAADASDEDLAKTGKAIRRDLELKDYVRTKASSPQVAAALETDWVSDRLQALGKTKDEALLGFAKLSYDAVSGAAGFARVLSPENMEPYQLAAIVNSELQLAEAKEQYGEVKFEAIESEGKKPAHKQDKAALANQLSLPMDQVERLVVAASVKHAEPLVIDEDLVKGVKIVTTCLQDAITGKTDLTTATRRIAKGLGVEIEETETGYAFEGPEGWVEVAETDEGLLITRDGEAQEIKVPRVR